MRSRAGCPARIASPRVVEDMPVPAVVKDHDDGAVGAFAASAATMAFAG